LEAIVLAAGSGSRFGGGKMFAPFNGAPLLHGALAAAFAAPVRGVTVVTGADHQAVGDAAVAFDPRVRLVHAADHGEGMGASLRTGAAALPADTAGVYVFLGDMPRIPASVTAELARALEEGFEAAAPVFDGRRGHPVLFGARLIPQLCEARGDAGAREVLKSLGARLALIETGDNGVLFDVDLPSHLTGG
jgi:molybdenum cofactor cytidylyltransferase